MVYLKVKKRDIQRKTRKMERKRGENDKCGEKRYQKEGRSEKIKENEGEGEGERREVCVQWASSILPEQHKELREKKDKQNNGKEGLKNALYILRWLWWLAIYSHFYLHTLLCLGKGTKISMASRHCPFKLGLALQQFRIVLSVFAIHFLVLFSKFKANFLNKILDPPLGSLRFLVKWKEWLHFGVWPWSCSDIIVQATTGSHLTFKIPHFNTADG